MATTSRRKTSDDFKVDLPPPLAPNATNGQRWRFRRNLVIYLASRNGLSHRLLSDVFDLPKSRIAAIIKEFGGLRGNTNSAESSG